MIWFERNAPEELKAFIDEVYEGFPKMLDHEQVLKLIEDEGYDLIEHFKLNPKRDWWDNFYTPMGKLLPSLRVKYQNNEKFLAALEMTEKEIKYFRKYSHFYGYMFYIIKKV